MCAERTLSERFIRESPAPGCNVPASDGRVGLCRPLKTKLTASCDGPRMGETGARLERRKRAVVEKCSNKEAKMENWSSREKHANI